MTRKSNVRKITTLKRSVKAISPVIATLLMIAIAVVASLVAYAFVMGYMGTTTTKVGHSIQIPSYAPIEDVGNPGQYNNIVVYVQNVGQGTVQLAYPDNSVYINDVPGSIILPPDPASTLTDGGTRVTLAGGQTVGLTVPLPSGYQPGDKLNIKVVTTDGTAMQATGTGTIGNANNNPTGPYSVTFVLGTGGATITPNEGVQSIAGGTPTPISATAANGFFFLSWETTGSISIALPSSASTTATVYGAGSITATFSQVPPVTHLITATSGANGHITPSGSVTVNDGADQTFNIVADANFHVLDVLIDLVSVGPQVSYTFPAVSTTHTISATFEANPPATHTIEASASVGGTISPDGSVIVNDGIDQAFTIIADTGNHYHLADVLVDDISVGAVPSYTFTDDLDHTIAANFALDTFAVTPSAGTHGTITPDTIQPVSYGQNSPTFTVTAENGYRIVNVLDGSTSLGGIGLTTFQYTFSNVQANHQISATFELIPQGQHNVIFSQIGSGVTVTVTYHIDSGSDQTGNCPFSVPLTAGQNIYYTYPDPIGTSGTRYVISSAASPGSPQTMGTSDIPVSATYKTQYQCTFTAGGLDADAGTTAILKVGSTTYDRTHLPSGIWFDSGTSYGWTNPVTVSSTEQFALTVGSNSTISGSSISATYQKQWKCTFQQSGLTSDSSGTVLTLGTSTYYTRAQLPLTSIWVDAGTTYSYSAAVSTTDVHKSFELTSTTGPSSPIGSAGTVTGIYGKLILRPESSGSSSENGRVGATSNWDCVDESSADGLSTYIYGDSNDNQQWDYYNIPNVGTITGTITSVTVKTNCTTNSTNSAVIATTSILYNSNYRDGADNTLTTGWVVYGTALSRPGGGSWSFANIDSTQIGIGLTSHMSSGNNWREARATQVWVEILFTPT